MKKIFQNNKILNNLNPRSKINKLIQKNKLINQHFIVILTTPKQMIFNQKKIINIFIMIWIVQMINIIYR